MDRCAMISKTRRFHFFGSSFFTKIVFTISVAMSRRTVWKNLSFTQRARRATTLASFACVLSAFFFSFCSYPESNALNRAFAQDDRLEQWKRALREQDKKEKQELSLKERIQEQEKALKEKQEKWTTGFSTEPFDEKLNKIPRNYRGHDLALINKITCDALAVDPYQYATQKAFLHQLSQKRQDLWKVNILGTIKLGSTIAICLPPVEEVDPKVSKVEYVEAKYSPNSKLLTVEARHYFEVNNMFLYPFEKIISNREYSAIYQRVSDDQNETEYALMFRAPQSDDEYEFAGVWRLRSIPEVFDRANRLAVCCVGQLDLLPAEEMNRLSGVNLDDSKRELLRKKNAVFVNKARFFIYDYDTGDIYARFNAKEMRDGVVKPFNLSEESIETTSASDVDELLDENLVVERTWRAVLDASADKIAKWERAPATIDVPRDYKTLAEALDAAKSGDVVRISKSSVDFAPRVPTGRPASVVRLDKAISILGPSDNPKNTNVIFTQHNSLLIENAKVNFKGINFKFQSDESSTEQLALIMIGDGARVTFKNCGFEGSNHLPTTGVSVQRGTAIFWKCSFQSFLKEALDLERNAVAKLGYCEIGPDNQTGVDVRQGCDAAILNCRIFDNRTGFSASEGGSGRIEGSFFEGNKSHKNVSSASMRNVRLSKDVVIID